MNRLFRHFQRSSLALALCAAGCSGGSSGPLTPHASVSTAAPANSTPAPSPASPLPIATAAGSSGQVRVTARIASTGLPLFSAASRAAASSRRSALSTSYQSLVFSGTIYPGYAGTATQTATSTLNTTTLPSTVGLAFASVPPGDNEWVVITVTAFTGQNGTGSSTPAGELGGLFNVGSSASVTVDNGSTLRLQLALAAMMDGLISTYELTNQTSLDSDLGNFIGQSGASANSSTALYSNATISQLLLDLVSTYQRQLTIAGSINGPSTAYVTWDYTNASELNYAASVAASATKLMPFDVSLIHFPEVIGNPNFGLLTGLATGVPAHAPSTSGPGLQPSVVSDGFDAPSGSATIAGVYGGALLVGVGLSSAYAPSESFGGSGGFASVGGRPRNSSNSVKVNVASSTFNLVQNDPEAGFFGSALSTGILPYGETFAPIDNAFTLTCHTSVCRGSQSTSVNSYTTGVNGASIDLQIDQFNPWALPTSQLALCIVDSGECFPSTSSSITSHMPFLSDTRFSGWPLVIPSSPGATTGVAGGDGSPYVISYTGSPSDQTNGYVAFNLGGTDAYFFGEQQLNITTSAPSYSTIYFDIGCGGTTYQNSSLVVGGNATITISSFTGLVTCQSVTIGYSIVASANGSFTLGPILPGPSTVL